MHDSIIVTEEPTDEPITLDEVKAHLKLLDDDSEDDLLAMYISAARLAFEVETDGRICLPTTFKQAFEGWPCYRLYPAYRPAYRPAYLPLGLANITSVEGVTYFDVDGVEQELEDWAADVSGCPALVYLTTGSWPALSLTIPRPVVVEFVAGWSDVDAVPRAVKLALLGLVGDFYGTREAHGAVDLKATPYGFVRFCQYFKTGLVI